MDVKRVTEQLYNLRRYIFGLSLESIFLIIFLIFGIIFTLIIPPGWNTDEPGHTYRITQLASGNLFSEKVATPVTGLKAYGGEVPVGLVNFYDGTGAIAPGATADTSKKVSTRLYAQQPELLRINDNGKTTPMNFSGAALYSPVSYIIYIPLFWLGKLLSVPYIWIILLCRLVGVVLTGLAFFTAIKYVPFGKWIFFGVGLIPTVVVQSATVGADAPQLILVVLTVTCIMRMLFLKGEPTLKQYVIVLALGILLTLTKLVYAPILLLLLLAPFVKKEYKNRREIIRIIVTLFIALLPSIIWTRLVSYIDINSNPQADFTAQKHFIISQPLTYLGTLYRTFMMNGSSSLNNLFGSFIWDSVPLPALYAYVATVVMVLTTTVRNQRENKIKPLARNNDRIWRVGLLSICLIAVVIIATALYVYSTTLHQSNIVGIQSRYFIPLLPLLLLAFYGNTVKNQRIVKIGVVLASSFVLVGAVLAVYSRLYQVTPLIIN